VEYLILPLLLICVFAIMAIKVARDYERFAVNRMGRNVGIRGPGIVFVVPFFEQAWKFDIRTKVREISPQQVITKDNVSAKVIVVYSYEILNPTQVGGDPGWSLNNDMAKSVSRVVGESTLDEIVGDREMINRKLREYVGGDNPARGWVVHSAEFKSIDLPPEMDHLLARESIAERERRAMIIAAEGEAAAADKLAAAAELMAQHPEALQLRALQSAETVGKEQHAQIIMPIGYEFFDGIPLPKPPDEPKKDDET
jgi:regulator of protease activity HflC (stomatin/prohibitin superfamily)